MEDASPSTFYDTGGRKGDFAFLAQIAVMFPVRTLSGKSLCCLHPFSHPPRPDIVPFRILPEGCAAPHAPNFLEQVVNPCLPLTPHWFFNFDVASPKIDTQDPPFVLF